MLSRLFKPTAIQATIDRIHGEIVAAARQPEFYRTCGVADTFEGRFELLTLHAALVLHHLAGLPAPGPALSQKLVDRVFSGLDAALRQMGTGDVVMPKRMARLLEAFSGRVQALQQALPDNDAALAQVLARNVLAGQGNGLALARYVRAVEARLAVLDIAHITKFPLPFRDPATIG